MTYSATIHVQSDRALSTELPHWNYPNHFVCKERVIPRTPDMNYFSRFENDLSAR